MVSCEHFATRLWHQYCVLQSCANALL